MSLIAGNHLRPALAICTVAFHEDDQEVARVLGDALYDSLSRPRKNPLAYGPGALVYGAVDPEAVALDEAETVVIIPVIGGMATAYKDKHLLLKIKRWGDALGDEAIVPVSLDENSADWIRTKKLKAVEKGNGAADTVGVEVLQSLLLRIAALLPDTRAPRPLAISHDSSEASEQIARQLQHHVLLNGAARTFFGEPLLLEDGGYWEEPDQTDVFLAIRTDVFGIGNAGSDLLLEAKRHRIPALTIEALSVGNPRSHPYGGNTPSLVWQGDPAVIVTSAMVEWIRRCLFDRQADRAAALADLPPDPIKLGRAPELFDLVQADFKGAGTFFVMHPDPELPPEERRVLETTRPRLHLTTPMTAFRFLGAAEGRAAPLDGVAVAMSVSEKRAANAPSGIEDRHVIDAVIRMCRCLVPTGAAIAYGGHLDPRGFTQTISDLLRVHDQTARDADERFVIYQAAHTDDDIGNLRNHDFRHLENSADARARALLPSPKGPHPLQMKSQYFSDMRRLIAEDTKAGIFIAGQDKPREIDDTGKVVRPGYVGRFPGVVEEAWWMVQQGKPLYVAGGLGGGAQLIASLLLNPDADIPTALQDKTWRAENHYSAVIKAFDDARMDTILGLPDSLEAMAAQLAEMGRSLQTDEATLAWNGLDLSENWALMSSRDPVLIASLTLKGLLKTRRRNAEKLLSVELIHGDIRRAQRLDALAVAVFDEAPILGAGKALNDALDNAVQFARSAQRELTPIMNGGVDADWLITTSLGSMREEKTTTERTAQATARIAEIADRYGLTRIGLVLFGGAIMRRATDGMEDIERQKKDQRALCRKMLDALKPLRGGSRIALFEWNKKTFDILNDFLVGEADVDLTTSVIEDHNNMPTGKARESEGFLPVFFFDDILRTSLLLPSGPAASSSLTATIDTEERRRLWTGQAGYPRRTPSLETLEKRGVDVARHLLGGEADAILAELGDASLLVHHDIEASQIPFETLRPTEGGDPPAVRGGMRRVVSIEGLSSARMFSRPPRKGKLRVQLVVDPMEDLKGARKEGEIVTGYLDQLEKTGALEFLPVMQGTDATVGNVLAAMGECDVFHYCGHSFYENTGDDESGLILAGNTRLTLDEIETLRVLPQVVFLNSCEGGKMRSAEPERPAGYNAQSFAEFFLGTGVEAFIGTFWEVTDQAAYGFAEELYARLAQGNTLDEAMLSGRRRLFERKQKDWANYLLYSRNADFRLVPESSAGS